MVVTLHYLVYGAAVIRRPLYKTLVHSLRQVNPQAAVTLEAAPRLRNPTKRNSAERILRTCRNVSSSDLSSKNTFRKAMPYLCRRWQNHCMETWIYRARQSIPDHLSQPDCQSDQLKLVGEYEFWQCRTGMVSLLLDAPRGDD